MGKDIYQVLGQRVRVYRQKLDWTQEELGERSGFHPSFIGQIERGTKKISLATLGRLSKALRVKMSGLLGEGRDYPPSNLEAKIAGLVRETPQSQQEFIYETIKNLTRLKRG